MADRSYGNQGPDVGRVSAGPGGARVLWPRRFAGAAIGIVATGAGLAAGEFVVGIVDDSASPVISVGQKVIDLVPLPLKNWAVDTFGTSDKVVLVVTTLAILFVVGIAVGMLAVDGRRRQAIGITVLVGLVGVAAVLTRPDPTIAKLAPIVVGTLVSVAVLWWLSPTPAAVPETARRQPEQAIATVGDTEELTPIASQPAAFPGTGVADRRVFLLRSAGVASLAVLTGGAGRLLQRRFDIGDERAALALPSVSDRRPAAILPPNTDFDVEGLSSFVTPNADFYRIDTALVVPQMSREDWRLTIHGMVERDLELTFDDLLARDQIEAYVTLACVSNPIGGPYVGNALWQGVRLADLCAEVGVDANSTQLLSTSVDGWTCGTPVSSLTDGRNAILAIAMNGEPLPAEHGYPVRMVVPGEYGYVSATKWVVDMEFTTWEDATAYWVPRGWSQQAPMKTMTRIEVPRHNATLAGGAVEIAGTAYAVHRGISAVEVRVDDGDWVRAGLGGVPSADTWRKWVVTVEVAAGDHTIEARATDGFGQVQTADIADVAPDGASGYDTIDFVVE
jgi:DMSO/TMAO reductase YedYZ molybdopterin-dependent catalytic subunit